MDSVRKWGQQKDNYTWGFYDCLEGAHITSVYVLSDTTSAHGLKQIKETMKCLLGETQKKAEHSHWGRELSLPQCWMFVSLLKWQVLPFLKNI